MGSSAPGGSTARPLPFTVAERPMPLLSVVRMRWGGCLGQPRRTLPKRQAALDGPLSEPLRHAEEAAAGGLGGGALLRGAVAPLEQRLEEGQLVGAAEAARGRPCQRGEL